MYKQVIIARKDLNMSPGKLAAQVSHASMAFLTSMIRRRSIRSINEEKLPTFEQRLDENGELIKISKLYGREDLTKFAAQGLKDGKEYIYVKSEYPLRLGRKIEVSYEPTYNYQALMEFDGDLYEQWINGSFTKCILQAKNKNQLLKAKTIAEELGMKKGEDFFLIRDECRTELKSEDEDGRTLTCIGFKPMDSEIIDKIGKKYHLYM